MHPDVRMGKKSAEDANTDFYDSFNSFHSLYIGKKSEAFVTKEEFLEYYKYESAIITSDATFDKMLNDVWNLDLKNNTDKQPFAGINSKIFAVSSKEKWMMDHHRTYYESPTKSELNPNHQ